MLFAKMLRCLLHGQVGLLPPLHNFSGPFISVQLLLLEQARVFSIRHLKLIRARSFILIDV